MGQDAALDAMPNRTDGQFAFEGPEGCFKFCKLNVLTPKGIRVHGIEISAPANRRPDAGLAPRRRALFQDHNRRPLAVFDFAKHRPGLGITLFETTKSTFDFACIFEPSASHNAA